MTTEEYRAIGVRVVGSELAYDRYLACLDTAQAFAQASPGALPGDNTIEWLAETNRKISAAWLVRIQAEIKERRASESAADQAEARP